MHLTSMLYATLAVSAAAAAAGPTEPYFTITLQEGRIGASQAPVGRNDGRVQQIELLSYSFGDASGVSKVDGFAVKQGVKPVGYGGGVTVGAGDVNDSTAGRGGSNAMRMEDSAGGADKAQSGHSMLGASDRVTVGGSQTESGQATGKRQHMPIRARGNYDQPLEKGSVRIKVKFPWLACRVGAHYPSLELAGAGMTYVLQDVTVASCGGSSAQDDRPTEEVAFYYNRIAH